MTLFKGEKHMETSAQSAGEQPVVIRGVVLEGGRLSSSIACKICVEE